MRSHLLGIPELTRTPAVAVVVDVLRAFTVAAWAFAGGAERIVLASSEDEALELKARHESWLALKDGPPAPGFDAFNSPAMLAAHDLSGRTIVQKTTAGTVGALAVADAGLVLCASFVVAGATARCLRERGAEEVTFVVTGEDGRAEEDRACAEYIGRRVESDEVDADPYLRRARESHWAASLAQDARRGYPGVHPDDVGLCLDADRFAFAMVAGREGALLVLRPVPVPSR
ncbi:putative 2-phosphosulfolactate phosphatase [Streptomyces sp. TUS-ST3]|uniref:2-phosphosulfolactate phosphatase n=1 Tax=Streptomyces sp. TUS-ST3 TaxID=3025591 RepID=UPI00235B5103|nr:2-phosphosulfolactate phosphatase [Streptomyces sp. TUS-ST3]GLP65243.1 putative 2-phosphosulfolactate phosphatase [Streptomyces sp. TUS-ST3]